MEMPFIFALAAAYYYVFHYYRHCTIWVLLSTICLQISDAGSSESIFRFFSPLFIMLHYYALGINSEPLELAAIGGALGLAIITSPAFKNEIVLPESRSAPRTSDTANKVVEVVHVLPESRSAPRTSDTENKVVEVVQVNSQADEPTENDAKKGRRIEIVTPSQPQPNPGPITPGKSILKKVVKAKLETPDADIEFSSKKVATPASEGKRSNRRKSGGGVQGMDSDVLNALTSSNEEETFESAPVPSTTSTKRRKSTGSDVLAEARAAARAEMDLAAQAAVNNITGAANRRGAKRRAPMPEEQIAAAARVAVAAVEAMDEDEDSVAPVDAVPSPKKLRTVRRRAAKLDL